MLNIKNHIPAKTPKSSVSKLKFHIPATTAKTPNLQLPNFLNNTISSMLQVPLAALRTKSTLLKRRVRRVLRLYLKYFLETFQRLLETFRHSEARFFCNTRRIRPLLLSTGYWSFADDEQSTF